MAGQLVYRGICDSATSDQQGPEPPAGHFMTGRSIDGPGLRVTCHAGYRGEEEPRRFHIGQRAVDVVEVIDRWTDPDHRYFKCRGSDGDIYILRHDVARDLWELTMYAKG